MEKKVNHILDTFSEKAIIKQQVFSNTYSAFRMVKSVLLTTLEG